MADSSDPQAPKLLEDIRREVVEARNMTIKTENALKSLHAELKNLSGQQRAFESRSWFSTGAAYLGMLVLAVVAIFAVSGARAAADRAEKERLDKQLADLTAQVAKVNADQSASVAAERTAAELYKTMTSAPSEDRLKGLDVLARLDQSKLSPFAKQVLADRAALLKKEVGAALLERGKAAFRRQDWQGTIDELGRFVALGTTGDDALEGSYYLGNAYLQVRKFDEAAKHLARYVEGDKKAKGRDFAMLMLMQSYEVLGQRDRSLEVAREALATYPASEFRAQFVARVQRREGEAGAAQPAPQPRPAPAPGTQPPPAQPKPAAPANGAQPPPAAQPAPATGAPKPAAPAQPAPAAQPPKKP